MTPALVRTLAAYRRLWEELGRVPTIAELSDERGICRESIVRQLEKLTVAGYCVPVTTLWHLRNGKVTPGEQRQPCAREQEAMRFITLLREADVLVSRYGHPEDAQWSAWRSKAAVYLNPQS